MNAFLHDLNAGTGNAVIRTMKRADVVGAGEVLFRAFNAVAARHGFHERMHRADVGTAWAWSLLHSIGDSKVLVAEVGDRIAGLCCLNPRGAVGNIGPVAVDPDIQGRGIGRQLMRALLGRAARLESLRLVQEAYNVASFNLYYALNFLPVESLLEFVLQNSPHDQGGQCAAIREASRNELTELCVFDIPRSGLDRRPDLAFYLQWGKVFVYRDGEIRGYLACLIGTEFIQLGPLLAEGEQEAVILFKHALGAFGNRAFRTRIMARDKVLANMLQEQGFRLQSLDNLMVRGPWRPGRSTQAFGIFPDGA